jgi:outer membrane protein OmpA-like peptidoglycan-associated protein
MSATAIAERRVREEESVPAANGYAAPPARGHVSRPHGPEEEAHEGAPEWLISFADNVMLQMGFFVILLGLAIKGASAGGLAKEGKRTAGGGSPTPEQLDFAIAVREAFNNPVDINSTNVNDLLLVRRLRQRASGKSDTAEEGLRGSEHDVQSIRRAEAYGTGGFISFPTRSNELDEAGRSAVEELATQFRGCQTVLEIRGHCSAAEAYGRDDRGMQLSYERALAVARGLVTKGLSWSQLRVTGCADGDRVTPTTYDEAGHRSNQRVEVIQLDQAAGAAEGRVEASAP